MITLLGTYSLQLFNQYIFFHRILAYGFRKDRRCLFAGVAAIFAGFISRIMLGTGVSEMIGEFLFPILQVLIPCFFFSDNIFRIILLSMNFRMISSFVYSTGFAVLQINGLADTVYHLSIFTQLVILFIEAGCIAGIKCRNLHLNQVIKDIRCMSLFILWIGLSLVDAEFGITHYSSEHNIHIVVGQSQMITGLIALMLILGYIILQIVFFQKKELSKLNLLKEQCIEEQVVQYQRVLQKDEALKKFRHDYKAHLSAIHTYLMNEDYHEAMAYLEDVGEVQESFQRILSGNMIFDAILGQYLDRGRLERINITFAGRFPQTMKIKDTDVCILCANAMSNAYEAASLCESERYIKIRVMHHGEYLFIVMTNPSVYPVIHHEKGLLTGKKESETHGIGTQNMKEIAEKYDGKVEWTYDKGCVTTTISVKYI